MVQKLRSFIAANWQPITLYSGLFAVLAFILYWQLGSLVGGYAMVEADSLREHLTVNYLLANPFSAPYLLAVKAASFILPDTILAARVISVGVGLLTLGLFCWLIQRWHGARTAVLATLLLGTSAWFLHITRLGTPEVLMLGLFLLVACGYWVRESGNSLMLLLGFVMLAVLLYVPGMIWFILLGAAWQWQAIDRMFKKHLVVVSVGALLFLCALAPLGWAFYKDIDLIRIWLGVPASLPHIGDMLYNLVNIPLELFIRHEADPMRWLGTVAILDVFTITMLFLGTYLYIRKIKLGRAHLFAAIVLVTCTLITLGAPITTAAILPFIYVVVAAGIDYMLREWFAVFPRNPLAKGLGLGVLGIVVLLTCSYHMRHYFVGWPQASATRDAFSVHQTTKPQ